ncbi:hypothetical protein Cgig2_026686 [Carnegiea gigantea]|uniref:Uncharacterized protein n=1 Tax=Carnegiea gigantea TaxID=171969 RepID=A0A9Q1GLD9_9CARY|nr:hypothetical protein Cgig2_026686 [Carnegiea gigantea]
MLYTSKHCKDYICCFVSLTMLDIENRDTLHLVERQPTQPQTSSSTGPADLSRNGGAQGNDGSAGAPCNHIGQISHSVVLGTLNVGDGVVSDLTQVIGAVLNSLGVGSQPTTNAPVVSQIAASVRFPIIPPPPLCSSIVPSLVLNFLNIIAAVGWFILCIINLRRFDLCCHEY